MNREVKEIMDAMTPQERQGQRRARLYEINQELSRVLAAQDELRDQESSLRSEKNQIEVSLIESSPASEGHES